MDVGDFAVSVDREKCMGYTNCVAAAPAVFEMDADDLVVVLDANPPLFELDNVRRAARVCPVRAIVVVEDSTMAGSGGATQNERPARGAL